VLTTIIITQQNFPSLSERSGPGQRFKVFETGEAIQVAAKW